MSECDLEVCHDIAPLSWHTVIEQGEWQAVEIAEAVLVWVMTVIPSAFTVHTQVPLTCRDTSTLLHRPFKAGIMRLYCKTRCRHWPL